MQIKSIPSAPRMLTMGIDSPLRHEDHRKIAREIERASKTGGTVRLVVVLRHYPSLNSAEDLLDDLSFVKLHADRIDRAAIVCDRAWKRTLVALFSLFSGVDMAFFDPSQTEAAAAWCNASGSLSG